MQVLIFGDSITQGYFDTAEGGWANRLARQYDREILKDLSADVWIEVFNLGVSGDTAAGVLARLENEVEARNFAAEQRVIILAIGTNDTVLRGNKADQDVYVFQETYERLIKTSMSVADVVIAVGLSAVSEPETDPWPYSSSGKQWFNNRLNLFEDTIKQAALVADIPFVPVHDVFLKQLNNGKKLTADGLHPNEAGHKLILELVQPVLDHEIKKLLA